MRHLLSTTLFAVLTAGPALAQSGFDRLCERRCDPNECTSLSPTHRIRVHECNVSQRAAFHRSCLRSCMGPKEFDAYQKALRDALKASPKQQQQ